MTRWRELRGSAALEWAAQAAGFVLGAWQGYGFGAAIGGPALGALASLNTGVLAAVLAGAVAERLCRPRPQRLTSSSTAGGGRPPGSP